MTITEALFHESEIKTNRRAADALGVLSCIIILFGIIGVAGVLDMGAKWSCYTIIVCGIINIICVYFIKNKIGIESPYAKGILISCTILLSTVTYFMYPDTTIFMLSGPLLIGISYYDTKFIVKVAIAAWISFIITLLLNCYLIRTNEQFVISHIYYYSVLMNEMYTIIYYYIIPRTLVFGLETAISIGIVNAGKRIVLKQAEVSTKAASMEAELGTAAAVQSRIMNTSEFSSSDGRFVINAEYRPAREVGGDFFDHFMINDHLMVVAVGDVSDKGLSAAMFAREVQSLVRYAFSETVSGNEGENEDSSQGTSGEKFCAVSDCIRENAESIENTEKYSDTRCEHDSVASDCTDISGGSIDIEKIMYHINRQLTKFNYDDMFVTMWIACIDTRTGMGKYVNAGHVYPYIRHADGSLSAIESTPQFFLGSFENVKYKSSSLLLNEGDTLIIYTDGITDARNRKDENFGTKRFEKIIGDIGNIENISAIICNRTIKELETFINKKDQFDDITLVAVNCLKKSEPQTKKLSFLADDEHTELAINELNILLKNAGCPEYELRNLDVVMDEICANVAMHSMTPTNTTNSMDSMDSVEKQSSDLTKLEISMEVGANYLVAEFSDNGIPFNPIAYETDGELSIGGLGIHLIKSLVDEMEYDYKEGKNKLKIKRIWNI